MNQDTARSVHARLIQACSAVNDTVTLVQNGGVIGEELTAYKLAAAQVLGELWFAFLKPIYEEHPALIPSDLNVERPDRSDWSTVLRAMEGR